MNLSIPHASQCRAQVYQLYTRKESTNHNCGDRRSFARPHVRVYGTATGRATRCGCGSEGTTKTGVAILAAPSRPKSVAFDTSDCQNSAWLIVASTQCGPSSLSSWPSSNRRGHMNPSGKRKRTGGFGNWSGRWAGSLWRSRS